MNIFKKGLMAAVVVFFAMSLQAQTINTQKSAANFTVKNMKWIEVEGNFTGMKGDIKFDEADLANSSFNVCVDAASVNTDNNARDKHLRNEDFFDVEKYTDICFASTSISKTSKGYTTKGQLTMHGVTKDVEIPFTYSNGTFTGDLKISRYDYKVGESTGTFMVSEDVNLQIIAVTN